MKTLSLRRSPRVSKRAVLVAEDDDEKDDSDDDNGEWEGPEVTSTARGFDKRCQAKQRAARKLLSGARDKFVSDKRAKYMFGDVCVPPHLDALLTYTFVACTSCTR